MDGKAAALVMIEFQREWLDEKAGKLNFLMKDRAPFKASIESATRALAGARAKGMTVIHVPCLFKPGYPEIAGGLRAGLFKAIPNAGTWITAARDFQPGFEPKPGEFVVEGRIGASAFAHSNLDMYCRSNDIRDLYLAGYAMHVCVESTMRQGHDLGYTCHLLEDASAAFTAEQKKHVIEAVVHHYGTHLTVDAYLATLEGRAPVAAAAH